MSDFKSPGLAPTPDIFGKYDDDYPTRHEYYRRIRELNRELEIALEHADRVAKSAAALLQMKIGDNKLEAAAQQLEVHVKYYQEYRAVLLIPSGIIDAVLNAANKEADE